MAFRHEDEWSEPRLGGTVVLPRRLVLADLRSLSISRLGQARADVDEESHKDEVRSMYLQIADVSPFAFALAIVVGGGHFCMAK